MKAIPFVLLFLIIVIINSCGAIYKSSLVGFTIKDAYYQSWAFNEKEKGTDVFIVLKNVKPGIEFNTIIFRGMELPISKTSQKGKTTLKVSFRFGLSKLEQKKKTSNKENQLIYQMGKERRILILKEIRRKNTKYY